MRNLTIKDMMKAIHAQMPRKRLPTILPTKIYDRAVELGVISKNDERYFRSESVPVSEKGI